MGHRYAQHCCSTYGHFSKCMYVWGCRALLLLTPTLDIASSQGVLLSACTHPWCLRMRRHDERPVAMDQQPQHSSAGKSRLCMLAKCRRLVSQPCPCPPTFHPHRYRCSAAVQTNTQANPPGACQAVGNSPHFLCPPLLYRTAVPQANPRSGCRAAITRTSRTSWPVWRGWQKRKKSSAWHTTHSTRTSLTSR